MTTTDVMKELKRLGTEPIRKIWKNHGAEGDFFGVKIGDMKVIQKKIKHDHTQALELFETGNADAMYFAGLISEPQKMTRSQLQHWVESARWQMLSECTVAWVTAEGRFGHELALEWIGSGTEHIAAAGWSVYSCLAALKKDDELDLKEIQELLATVKETVHDKPNRVRSAMNSFVIFVGTYVAPLTKAAKAVASAIGEVTVEVGNTACQVPSALSYIEKMEEKGKIGKKKKTVFC
jgi:3-methyladenine DNA glycosylase AlkD